jgi:photosystem II stability/assembly factor-like uncharacterized protein
MFKRWAMQRSHAIMSHVLFLRRLGLFAWSALTLPVALCGVLVGPAAADEPGLSDPGHAAAAPGPLMTPSIQALVTVGPNTIYAGSFGLGIFRSDDRGHSWSVSNTGMTDPFVLSLAAAADGTVYAGTFRGGVFRTRNGGRTWDSINAGLKRLEIKALLISRGTIYAGTGDGLYRLSEGGAEWNVVTKGLDDVLVHSIAVAPDRTLYVGTSGKGLLRHTPESPEWQRVTHGLVDHEGLRENFIRALAMDRNHTIYAGTFDGGVFRSGDGGVNWRPISRALPNDSIRSIVLNGRGLYVATGRGIFKSMNEGGQWTALNKGLTELSVQVLISAQEGVLYAGTSAGVFRSDDDGTSWIGISQGLAGVSEPPIKYRRQAGSGRERTDNGGFNGIEGDDQGDRQRGAVG